MSAAVENQKRVREACEKAGYADVKIWVPANVLVSADECIADVAGVLTDFERIGKSDDRRPTENNEVSRADSSSSEQGAQNRLPEFSRNFSGAVGLANWIKLNSGLFSETGDIEESQSHVWPEFKRYIERLRAVPINLFLRDELTTVTLALRTPPPHESFSILVPSSFNHCYRRFAVCTELCHILTDDVSLESSDPVSQIEAALATLGRVQSGGIHGTANPLFLAPVLSSEDFCFLLSLELLIPIRDREKIVVDVMLRGVSCYDVAYRLRVPEQLIRFYVQSGYNNVFKQLGGSVEEVKPGRPNL
jgi:hypothetical protein